MNIKDRIIRDPKILAGKPTIKGTRIPVSLILNQIAHGYSFDRIIEAYPNLIKEDIVAAIKYSEAQVEAVTRK